MSGATAEHKARAIAATVALRDHLRRLLPGDAYLLLVFDLKDPEALVCVSNATAASLAPVLRDLAKMMDEGILPTELAVQA